VDTRIRFRSDSSHVADLRAVGKARPDYIGAEEWDAVAAAQPGDTWRVHWYKEDADGNSMEGPFAGYDICCPGCRRVHAWTTALNCLPKPCPHEGKGSCWQWTGSAEEGTLTASPSLYSVKEKGGCGWHGFLANGTLRG
jgi:hypothetical protein